MTIGLYAEEEATAPIIDTCRMCGFLGTTSILDMCRDCDEMKYEGDMR